MNPLYAEYLSIVDAELDAESNALDITHRLHDEFYLGNDGEPPHLPSQSDLAQELAAWAIVADVRSQRHRWIVEHS